jgi:hypothetical protein
MTPLALDSLDALDSTASAIGSTGWRTPVGPGTPLKIGLSGWPVRPLRPGTDYCGHCSEQLHEFAFIPFLFPFHLPYSSAALAHSLNSLLVDSCSPAHNCRWKQLSLRIDHSAIAAFGLYAGPS